MSTPSILPQAFPSWDLQHVHTVAMAATQHIQDNAEREAAYIAARAQVCAGMSLRDYFASHASLDAFRDEDGSISLFSAKAVMDGNAPNNNTPPIECIRWWIEAEVRLRFLVADAMLKARGS